VRSKEFKVYSDWDFNLVRRDISRYFAKEEGVPSFAMPFNPENNTLTAYAIAPIDRGHSVMTWGPLLNS
jgi:hypothetical protein